MTGVLVLSYLISLLYEYSGMHRLFGAFFVKIEKPKRRYYYFAFILELISIHFSFNKTIFPNIPVILCMISIAFILLMNYEGNFLSRVLIGLLNYSCMIISESIGGIIICAIAEVPIACIREKSTIFIYGVVLMRLIYYTIIRTLTIFVKRKQFQLKFSIITSFIVISIIFILILMNLYYIAYLVDDPDIEVFIVFAATIFILAIYILVIILDKLYEERMKNERLMVLECQVESQKEHYEELCNANTEARRIYHDLKNTLIAVDGMLKAKQYEELSHYISLMNEKGRSRESIIDTGILAIDSILNSKIKTASEEEIEIKLKIMLPDIIKIDLIELSIVIANLLDNGIEAVSNLSKEKRKIMFQLVSHGDYIAIQTENITDNSTFVGIAKTTKLKKEVHGYGLQSVREIVQKYDGTMQIYCKNGLFKLQLMLKNDTFASK